MFPGWKYETVNSLSDPEDVARVRHVEYRLAGSERRTTGYQVVFRASVVGDGTITNTPGIDIERDDADGEVRRRDVGIDARWVSRDRETALDPEDADGEDRLDDIRLLLN